MLAAGLVLVAVLVVMGCPWPCSREPTTRFLALLDSAPSWQRRLSKDGSSAQVGDCEAWLISEKSIEEPSSCSIARAARLTRDGCATCARATTRHALSGR